MDEHVDHKNEKTNPRKRSKKSSSPSSSSYDHHHHHSPDFAVLTKTPIPDAPAPHHGIDSKEGVLEQLLEPGSRGNEVVGSIPDEDEEACVAEAVRAVVSAGGAAGGAGNNKRRRRSDLIKEDGTLGECKICGSTASGVFFGVLTCIPCKVGSSFEHILS